MNSMHLPSYDGPTPNNWPHMAGKDTKIKECPNHYGDALCPFCFGEGLENDFVVIGSEYSTVSIGDQCEKCGSKVIGFSP
jgi:hypothetical protein